MAAPDGPLRSELSLGGYTIAIAYAPALNANDPAHRDLMSAGRASSAARVRVAQLDTNGSLRIGDAAIGKRDPAGTRYDVWLQGTSSGWQLELVNAAEATAGTSSVASQIPLERQTASASPQFVAALAPDAGTAARLVLRWGSYEAAADIVLIDPPQVRRTAETTPPNTTVNRTHDEDTSALSRVRLLAQRNETALVLPKGQRLSVTFQRTFAKGERGADGGGVRSRGLPADGPDFARLASTADGAVVMLTQSAVPRLAIDAPLRFGKTLIPTGNLVPGFPGSYGLWLKRAASGWRLVFNNEPDAWGSQHDPKFDAAEIELKHSEGHAAARPFAVGVIPTAPDRGRLLILWGPHEWTADFTVGS
jgi:hypothetical protein